MCWPLDLVYGSKILRWNSSSSEGFGVEAIMHKLSNSSKGDKKKRECRGMGDTDWYYYPTSSSLIAFSI